MAKVKYPNMNKLASVIAAVRSDISDEYRAWEDDECPGIQLTIGFTPETGEWDYQTGDNSFTGGAYGHPDWAVVGVYRDSNARELARDIVDQLAQLHW